MMTPYPVTKIQATKLAHAWFDAALGTLADYKFSETVSPQFKLDKRGKPSYHTLVRAAQNEMFALIAVLDRDDDAHDDAFFPLLYLVERHHRNRPSGFGNCQPYGKRTRGTNGLIVPEPDFNKIAENIRLRMTQTQASTAGVELPDSVAEFSLQPGIFVFKDTSDSAPDGPLILHIPCIRVTSAQARAVAVALGYQLPPSQDGKESDLPAVSGP